MGRKARKGQVSQQVVLGRIGSSLPVVTAKSAVLGEVRLWLPIDTADWNGAEEVFQEAVGSDKEGLEGCVFRPGAKATTRVAEFMRNAVMTSKLCSLMIIVVVEMSILMDCRMVCVLVWKPVHFMRAQR